MSYLDEVFKQTADEGYFDFARCQRADGSHYGTGGTCRKGDKVGAREVTAAPAEKASRLTQKKIGSLSDEQLKSLIKNPKLRDYQRDRLNQELDKRSSGDSPKSDSAVPKEPKGLFSKGSNVDFVAVEKAAEEWRNKAGLQAFPHTMDWDHDKVHVLTHSFLGGSNKIGEWIGQGSKSPTPAEETLVNMVHRAGALKGRGDDYKLSDNDLKRYVTRDIQLLTGRNQISDSDMKLYYTTDKNGDSVPDTAKFIAKYREMEKTPGFDKLLDAAHTSFSNVGDIIL